ncbi:potassium channel family protein [Fervidobacterium sp.]
MKEMPNSSLKLIEETIIKRVKKSILLIALVFLTGTLYYWLFEGLSFIESLFFTGITISTVGYGMPETLSNFGKIFTLILILAGLSVVLYSVSYITALLIEGDLIKLMKLRRIERRVSKVREHVIVVGVGNIGTQVVNQLLRAKETIVAIDNKLTEEEVQKKIFSNEGQFIYVEGDATNEEVLLRAGIKHARALITTLPNDAMNIFVTLTAKNLNSNVYVVSNITDLNNLTKFIYAGVDHPIATAEIAGIKMVETVSSKRKKEAVLDVLNIKDKTFRVEIIDVKGTRLSGKKIEGLMLKEKYNVYIVAILRNEDFILGPSKNDVLTDDCRIVLFGEISGINTFRKDYLD